MIAAMVRAAPVNLWDYNLLASRLLSWLQASPVRALLANFSHPVSSGEHGGNGCRGHSGTSGTDSRVVTGTAAANRAGDAMLREQGTWDYGPV